MVVDVGVHPTLMARPPVIDWHIQHDRSAWPEHAVQLLQLFEGVERVLKAMVGDHDISRLLREEIGRGRSFYPKALGEAPTLVVHLDADRTTRLKPGESEPWPTAEVDDRIARADEPLELAGVHLPEGLRERLVVAMVGGSLRAAVVSRDPGA